VIQPAQLLALSLIALGASTLHGVRYANAPVPGTPRPLIASGAGAASTSVANARDRAARMCVSTRTRGRHASDCAEQ
jgi:hypothetical protein